MFIRIFSPASGKLVLKDAILNAVADSPKTRAKKIFYSLKKQGTGTTYHGVYKALRQLVEDQFLLEENKEYSVNPLSIEKRIKIQQTLLPVSLLELPKPDDPINFEPLDLIPTYLTEFQTREYVDGRKSSEEILKQFRNILILGDAGAGKTTLLKIFAAKEREQVPVFLPLCQYSGTGFIVFIKEQFHAPLSKEQIEHHLEQGAFFLFWDGLDETEYNIIQKLNSFMKKYPKNKFIVTARTSHDPKEHLSILTFKIAELTEKQIENILKQKDKLHLWKTLPVAVKELCKTPLHITMLLHIKKKLVNDAKKIDLYNAFITYSLKQSHYSNDLRKLLARLAYKTQETIPYALLLEETAQLAKEEQWDKTYEKEILDALLKCSLLQQTGVREYQFVHQRIQEFFVALHMTTKTFDKKDIKKKAILPLYVSLLQDPQEIIHAIFAEFGRTADHEYLFLAAKCLKEVKHFDWNNYQGILSALLNIYNYTDSLFYPHWYLLREIFQDWNDEYVIKTIFHFFEQCEEEITPRLVNILYHMTIRFDEKRMQALKNALITSQNKHLQYSIIEILGLQQDISMSDELQKFLKAPDPILICQTARTLHKLQIISSKKQRALQEQQKEKLLSLVQEAKEDFRRGHALIELSHIDYKQALPYIEKALLDKKPIVRYHASYILPRITEEEGTMLLQNLMGAEAIMKRVEVEENE